MLTAARNPKHHLTDPPATPARSFSQGGRPGLRVPRTAVLALKDAIVRLPPDQRATLVLRELEGLSYEEIAHVLGTTVPAVKGRLHRARLALLHAMRGRAAGWSVFSSLPQPLVAVPAFLFVAFFDGLVPAGLGFAGGAMLWMVAAQVVPDAVRTSSRRSVALALAGSTVAMLALEALLLT